MIVVKVGGSLFDLPDLGPRLESWLGQLQEPHILLVPGGGAAADAVRATQLSQGFNDEVAHWQALKAMTGNAHRLAALLRLPVIDDPWTCHGRAVLDGLAFARADESRLDHLPHNWTVTSDSLAARAASIGGARRLILLKSIDIPEGTNWDEAARRGWVDSAFASVSAGLKLEAINFRNVPLSLWERG